jgi:hypothetical protein
MTIVVSGQANSMLHGNTTCVNQLCIISTGLAWVVISHWSCW